MKQPEDYRSAGEELYQKLRINTFPVAVKYIKAITEIPEGFTSPSALGQKWSLCQAFAYARRHGGNVAMTAEDNFCLPTSFVHHWIDITVEELIESQRLNKWRKDVDAEIKVQSLYADLMTEENRQKTEGHIGLIASPLTKTQFIPDSILLYGSPGQLMHVIHALSYEGKHLIQSPFNGYGESCIKGGLMPFLTGKPQVVLLGGGDRVFALASDDEMAIGIPGAVLFDVAENLFKTGEVFNVGQPIKATLSTHLTENILPGWVYLKERLQERKTVDPTKRT